MLYNIFGLKGHKNVYKALQISVEPIHQNMAPVPKPSTAGSSGTRLEPGISGSETWQAAKSPPSRSLAEAHAHVVHVAGFVFCQELAEVVPDAVKYAGNTQP